MDIRVKFFMFKYINFRPFNATCAKKNIIRKISFYLSLFKTKIIKYKTIYITSIACYTTINIVSI